MSAPPVARRSGLGGLVDRLGHPGGLYVLFFAEAWERFSYYGMRALLVLYLTQSLDVERSDALQIYATYTGLVYLTPYFGGMLADKVLGARKAILIGGVVMALGHLAMAFESLLYPALGLLIVGNGFFKPNISTIVGDLYHEGDERRDAGFTIFYMGINLGAGLSPLVCGTLGELYSWHMGFAAAGVGMVAGLLVFSWGQKLLGSAGYPPEMGKPAPGTPLRPKDWGHVVIWTVGSIAVVYGALSLWSAIDPLLTAMPAWLKGVIGAVLLIVPLGASITGARVEGPEAVQRHVTIMVLCFFVIFFWAGFEQAGGTMNLFAYEQTDRNILGLFELPATWLQSANSAFLILMAPLMAMLWPRLARSRFGPNTAQKMATGLVILGLSFIVMYAAQQLAESRNQGEILGQVGLGWLLVVYFMHTVSELMLSPIGLSMVTKLSVPRMASLMMGVWFVATGLANYLAGTLESLLHTYDVPLYGFLVCSSLGAGFVLFALSGWLGRWSHGRD